MSLKLLFLTARFWPTIGGAENRVCFLARALGARGHSVTVGTARCRNLPRVERLNGAWVYRGIPQLNFRPLYGAAYLGWLGAFLLARAKEFDVIQISGLYLDAIAAGLVRGTIRTPIIVVPSCGGSYGDVCRLRTTQSGRLLRRMVKRFDAAVALSEEIRTELCGAGFPPDRVEMIPNGVDLEQFHPAPGSGAGSRDTGSPPTAIFVGRLDSQKGVWDLLQAWALVAREVKGIRLLVVGNGPDRGQLEARGMQLGIEGSVTFVGQQVDVAAYLRKSDVFVLPSLAEGMPNALLEAMATGLPCVATRVGGNVNLIEDRESGWLVTPGRAAELADAIVGITRDPVVAARLGRGARERVERAFSRELMLDRYLDLYHRLANSR